MVKPTFNMDVDSPCGGAHPKTNPERTLLAAILDRAFRDLDFSEESKNRVKAINWFNCSSDCPDYWSGFRYCDCVEGLELSSTQATFIQKAVNKAEAYEYQCLSQGERRRKKRGELVEGQRYYFGEEV